LFTVHHRTLLTADTQRFFRRVSKLSVLQQNHLAACTLLQAFDGLSSLANDKTDLYASDHYLHTELPRESAHHESFRDLLSPTDLLDESFRFLDCLCRTCYRNLAGRYRARHLWRRIGRYLNFCSALRLQLVNHLSSTTYNQTD